MSCDTFYIVTSPSSPCPGEYIGVPCLTLQQYAANPGQGENITFLIDSGMYSLSTVLTISDVYNFTISSTDVTVTCTSATARLEFYRVKNIHISGVTFQGCRNGAAVHITTATSTAIIGSLFIRNCAGVQMSRVTMAIVMRSNFTQNNGNVSFQASNSMVTFDKSNFYGSRFGDQIYSSYSNISIKNSRFNNNGGIGIRAKYSSIIVDSTEFNHNDFGAISVYQSSNFQINNTIFYGNRASHGGAISLSLSSGSRTHLQSHVQINNTAFYFNKASYQGGAIYLSYDAGDWYQRLFQNQVCIHNATFHSNVADYGDGGAIYNVMQKESGIRFDNYWWQLSIVESLFINNAASLGNGGAIMLYEPRQNFNPSVITKCQFINNMARNASGGAIYKDGKNTKLVINQNSYDGNTADAFGGAIYVSGENNSIQVTSTTFRNNTAVRESGGAIYSNGRYANVILTSSIFHNNSASYCSVLSVDNYNHFSVNLTNSIFTYNTASEQTIGGGVACIRNASINIIDNTFKHNFANFHAGVFYIEESHTTVDRSLFINNSAALDGGVFYTHVHASDYIIRRSQFSVNTAGHDGGVILIERLNCYVSIDECIFDFNSAGNRGGVISMVASSLYMVISRINIFNNTAQFGGVISACNSKVTQRGGSLVVTEDPRLPFCKLYDGTVQHDYITPPPETVITTEPMVAIIQITTSVVSGVDKRVVISIVVSLLAILLFITIIVLMICIYKKGPLKNILSRMKGFSINPSHTYRRLNLNISPIYNPNSSEDEDDTDAL